MTVPETMQRVLVIGSGGAGKSTLAAELARILDLPLVHLDARHWHPGWVPTPAEEWRGIVESMIAEPRWVMDGNYGGTLDLRLARCDTVIFLDLPRHVCLWRVLKRRLRFHGRSRPDLTPGCPEQLSWEFVRWVWTYPASRRAGILAKLNALGAHQRAIVLSSQRDIRRFLESVRARVTVAA